MEHCEENTRLLVLTRRKQLGLCQRAMVMSRHCFLPSFKNLITTIGVIKILIWLSLTTANALNLYIVLYNALYDCEEIYLESPTLLCNKTDAAPYFTPVLLFSLIHVLCYSLGINPFIKAIDHCLHSELTDHNEPSTWRNQFFIGALFALAALVNLTLQTFYTYQDAGHDCHDANPVYNSTKILECTRGFDTPTQYIADFTVSLNFFLGFVPAMMGAFQIKNIPHQCYGGYQFVFGRSALNSRPAMEPELEFDATLS